MFRAQQENGYKEQESPRKGSTQCPDPVNPLLLPEVANKAADYRQFYPRVFITLPDSL